MAFDLFENVYVVIVSLPQPFCLYKDNVLLLQKYSNCCLISSKEYLNILKQAGFEKNRNQFSHIKQKLIYITVAAHTINSTNCWKIDSDFAHKIENAVNGIS